jgi:hypothetical protein
VEISRTHRFGQIEAANLPMVGFATLLMGRLDEVFETSVAAVRLTQRMGNRRAEIVAHHGCAVAHLERGESELARPHAQAAVDLSRAIGARRFEPESVLLVAACVYFDGERQAAIAMMREALAGAREHIHYCGPMILGYLAHSTADREERARCLEEGAALIEAGSSAHNRLYFCRGAIEAAVEQRDWAAALRYADLLERQFSEEPPALVDFLVARGRALAAVGEGRRDPVLRSEVLRLRAAARKSRYVLLLAALESAAAAAGWGAGELSA